jgi:hypothetical protein
VRKDERVRAHHRVLTAFFPGRAEAAGAFGRLIQSGVPRDAISVLPKSVHHLDDIGVKAASKASEGAALGAIVGGLSGALLGVLAAAGSLVVPGAGAVVAGPIVAALAGAGAGGALGVIAGAALGARLPEYEAAYLEDAVRMGGALLAVRCSADHAPGVAEILTSSGGRRIRRARRRAAPDPAAK